MMVTLTFNELTNKLESEAEYFNIVNQIHICYELSPPKSWANGKGILPLNNHFLWLQGLVATGSKLTNLNFKLKLKLLP